MANALKFYILHYLFHFQEHWLEPTILSLLLFIIIINFEAEFSFVDLVGLALTMKTKLTLKLWNSSNLSFSRAEITGVDTTPSF